MQFSSQALHFDMRAVFRLNLLFQRWPNARSFTGGGGVCLNHMSLVLLRLIAADVFFSPDPVARVAGGRASVLRVSVSTFVYAVLSMTRSLFTQPHFTPALHQWAQCASSMRSCPRLTTTREGYNTWNVLLDLFTNFDFWAMIQSSLADEKLGRVRLSCHYAMDCLCAEFYAL